jgi:hypothetical protein
LKVATLPQNYGLGPESDYLDRAVLLDRTDKTFRDESIARSVAFFENAPYHEDLPSTRERAMLLSQGRARVRTQKLQEQRRREVVESRIATSETYKHDLYHLDEMFSKKFKSLRIIPVSNRVNTDVPVSKLPFI